MTSLVVLCRLRLRHNADSSGLVYDPLDGTISNLGFADFSDWSNLSRPPHAVHPRLDGWVSDKFIRVEQGERLASLGHAKIEEARAYDNMMRGELETTGLKLSLALNARAWRAYRDYVGEAPQVDYRNRASWDGGLAFMIPCQSFDLPPPRTTADPWASSPGIGNLQPIASFDFQTMTVFKLVDLNGNRLAAQEALLAGANQLGHGLHLPAE